MMGAVEKWILENPDGTAKDFRKVPPFIFNESFSGNLGLSVNVSDLGNTLIVMDLPKCFSNRFNL